MLRTWQHDLGMFCPLERCGITSNHRDREMRTSRSKGGLTYLEQLSKCGAEALIYVIANMTCMHCTHHQC